jgi:hypothetical protein
MTVADKDLVARTGRGAAAEEEGVTLSDAELEAAAQPIIESLQTQITQLTNEYTKKASELAKGKGDTQGLTDSRTLPYYAPAYNWWDMYMAGPYQPIPGGAAGPFSPSKIIRAGEPAFMICVLWRNPAPIGWAYSGPSAATVMSPYNVQIRLESINLSTVQNGPDFVPPALTFGPGFLNFLIVPLSGFSVPPQGRPNLFEINMTADVTGPGAGLPFAGYSTWLLNPDNDLPFFFLPGSPAGLRHDVPARVLVYRA